MVAIKTIDLSKKYGDLVAVDRLNMEINNGELFSLIGVNGSGKTTTIKMLTGITAPTFGDAILCEKSILKNEMEFKSKIGYSPQETAIAPNLSVKENLELICGIHGFDKKRTKGKVEELSKTLGLVSELKKKAGVLSGGWQRRLSIAMALIIEPEVLFLDEPTLGLDVLARSELWEIIKSLKGSVTILLTTHYMEEVEELSDRVGIIDKGRLLKVGTVGDLMKENGVDRFEQAFIKILKEAGK